MNEQAWKEQAALEPCPFCGFDAELRSWEWPYERYQVYCPQCKCAAGSRKSSREYAIKQWNTRPLVQPAIAAERGEPVAWMYERNGKVRIGQERSEDMLPAWTEAPLYPAPPTEAQIRADERERCAKVADDMLKRFGSPIGPAYDCGLWDQGVRITAAIRSLKESDNGAG